MKEAEKISVKVLMEYAMGSRAGHRGFIRRSKFGKISFVPEKGKSPEAREAESLQKKLKKRKIKRALQKKIREPTAKKRKGKKQEIEGATGMTTAEPGKRAAGQLTAAQSVMRAWLQSQGFGFKKVGKKSESRLGR